MSPNTSLISFLLPYHLHGHLSHGDLALGDSDLHGVRDPPHCVSTLLQFPPSSPSAGAAAWDLWRRGRRTVPRAIRERRLRGKPDPREGGGGTLSSSKPHGLPRAPAPAPAQDGLGFEGSGGGPIPAKEATHPHSDGAPHGSPCLTLVPASSDPY